MGCGSVIVGLAGIVRFICTWGVRAICRTCNFAGVYSDVLSAQYTKHGVVAGTAPVQRRLELLPKAPSGASVCPRHFHTRAVPGNISPRTFSLLGLSY